MYCSSCGVAVAQDLRYCNYCGAKVNEAGGDRITESPGVKPEPLVTAMVALFVFGLGAIMGLMAVMKALNLYVGQILAFTFLSFLMMLLLEGVFIWQLLRGKHSPAEVADAAGTEQSTREIEAAQARMLTEPGPSVTEHTTRAFEPTYSEQYSARAKRQ